MDFFRSTAFRTRVQELMKRHHVPGLAVAIVSGQDIASEGFGFASVKPAVPCTADTLFDIASSSKSLTAASVALLVDNQGEFPEIRWDSALSKLLPEDFVMSDPEYTSSLTIDDMVGHRTGLPGHDYSYMSVRSAQPDSARSVTRNLRHLAIAAPMRSKYMYCNIMYTVATHLIEVKTGQPFAEFLQENFFTPLQMNRSFLQPASAREHGYGHLIAQGHHWEKKKKAYRQFDTPDCPDSQGAGSIITCVNDYIKWVKAIMNNDGPVTKSVYAGLMRMRSFPNAGARFLRPYTSPVFYTAGLEIYWYRGYMVVGHDGCVPGFGSRHFFMPEIGFAAVIFGNSGEAGTVAGIVSRELIDDALGVPDTERVYRTPSKKKPVRNSADSSLVNDQTRNVQTSELPLYNDASLLESQTSNPLHLPLNAYVGSYHNPGYHIMTVQIKENRLFIDATDRSMGFTLLFERRDNDTDFDARFSDFLDGCGDTIDAVFDFADGRATRLGLDLEEALGEKIWFERMPG